MRAFLWEAFHVQHIDNYFLRNDRLWRKLIKHGNTNSDVHNMVSYRSMVTDVFIWENWKIMISLRAATDDDDEQCNMIY